MNPILAKVVSVFLARFLAKYRRKTGIVVGVLTGLLYVFTNESLVGACAGITTGPCGLFGQVQGYLLAGTVWLLGTGLLDKPYADALRARLPKKP